MNKQETEQAKSALRQKNFSKRLAQMAAGLAELENWLIDTIRQGIALLEQQPYSFWKDISARMYDAKLGAIGKRLKAIPLLIDSEADWSEKVLEELATYYLLIRGLRKMEELPLNMQQDLLSYAGVTTRKEDLFQHGQLVKDTWMVLAQVEGVEDNLNYRRTWLYGWQTARYGLIMAYAFGNNPYPDNYKKGSVFQGTVVYYPSNTPLRVAIKEKLVLERRVKRIVGFSDFAAFLDYYAANIAANPWQISFPCAIENVLPIFEHQTFLLIDKNKKRIPVLSQTETIWKIIAVSGGHSIHVFGEWTGDYFLPLSMTVDEKYISF